MGASDVDFNLAVRRYIGHGVTSFPKEDSARLIAEFGPELGKELEVKVKNLLEELDRIKPEVDASPFSSAKRAAAELKSNHQELDPNTIAALEWIYSWWWK